jgi:endonuclease YncB( thermonuclease family)
MTEELPPNYVRKPNTVTGFLDRHKGWSALAVITAVLVFLGLLSGLGHLTDDSKTAAASETVSAAAPTPATIAAPTTTPAPSTTTSTADPTPTTTAPPATTVAPTTTPAPALERAPAPEPAPESAVAPVVATNIVTHVVDGDTVDLDTGERVRIIGIDTPEKGQCGYSEATVAMSGLLRGKAVVVTAGARDDVDRYGRILRYISVDGVDVGQAMIQGGYAVARYDSRDGYGHHANEEQYVAADEATPQICASQAPVTTAPEPAPIKPAPAPTAPAPFGDGAYYKNCAAARAAGVAPILRGQPGYSSKLDADGDGIACEWS